MDIATLKSTLEAFTDQPESLLVEKGHLLLQLGEEVVSAEISVRDGQVHVSEGGVQQTAEKWLVHRIANLDMLADRILGTPPDERAFVRPRGKLVDQLEQVPADLETEVPDALSTVRDLLDRRPAGTCSVLYLTSDAGEGKTTLINQLAQVQARQFKENKTDWLLVPISLGGRPFLRFDDVVAAALLNQLRFRRLYFEAFLQLVRLGFIVPALDGFEEIFIETAEGDAVTSLGNLIRQMGSEGSLLIAARKAYFEFKALDQQAKLLDALPEADVAFSRLKLSRWTGDEFIQYCRLHNVERPEHVYEQLSIRVGITHPLLTRAVFVKRLAEIAKGADREKFLSDIRPETEDYFSPFIDQILDREIKEKWIDKYGDPPQPLLSVEQHHELLRLIAEEMWISKTGFLSLEMCGSLAELFCETKHFSSTLARQVRERISQHALLVAFGSSRGQIAFDHDHFREFFLGEQLGIYLSGSAKADLRKLLRIDTLLGWTLDTAVSIGVRHGTSIKNLLETVLETARSESPASFVRENCGALSMRLLERFGTAKSEIEGIAFPAEAFQGRHLENARFSHCYFRPCSFDDAKFASLEFESCEFEHLSVQTACELKGVRFQNCKIRGLTVQREEERIDIYDPEKVNRYCEMIGASVEGGETSTDSTIEAIISMDTELHIIRKLLMIFMRSTQVSDHVLELRLGIHSHKFFTEVKGDLLHSGVLKEVKHAGGGQVTRFKLGISVSKIEDALTESKGSYSTFQAAIGTNN